MGMGLVKSIGFSDSRYHPSALPANNPDSISYVSLGDGSVNNAHFLSAANMVCGHFAL